MRRSFVLLALLTACDGDKAPSTDDTAAEVVPVEGCRATPLPKSAPRLVAASLPYTASGAAADSWTLLQLKDETLSATGVTFEMGRGGGDAVVWSPDGSLGVAVQDDGSLGVFTAEGEVVHAAWSEGLYAGDVMFDPKGETLWVIDGNWVENGGGVYEVGVDCATGALSLVGLVVQSKLGEHLLGDVLIADAAAQTITLPGGALGQTTDLFGHEDAIVGGAARRGDTIYVGDNSAFSSEPNRVAVASVGDTITPLGLFDVYDPYAIVAVEGGAIVSSGFGDEIIAVGAEGVLDVMPSELPGAVTLGPDELALVAEVSGVRLVRLEGGALVEIGFFDTPALEDMIGSLGVQP
ncbi:MAG: hypothetical protein IPN01_23285 [Deltaproteobacteria bacterium]|nr:hypothetical protein [Deltaproteobacteria bacterium]